MFNTVKTLIDRLYKTRKLSLEEYEFLIDNYSIDAYKYAAQKALNLREFYYGKKVFIRGLIEISNICKNDCFYCGIRKSNKFCSRYRLTKEDILNCCKEGYSLGFRTFVLQGGEDPYFDDNRLTDIIKSIKKLYPDCAVTLSLGERSKESYAALKNAGADRYLLRHETADSNHYSKLHPINLNLNNRVKCLIDLKAVGFQVGCGFMVGSPYQTSKTLAKDLKFIEEFKPDMCGIGPFISHKDTPFKDEPNGSVELTLYLLSLIRIIHPPVLLPATTALGTLNDNGRENGILSGANVIMPNLSPKSARQKYMLYDNKKSDGDEAAESLTEIKNRMQKIGYEIAIDRGDVRKDI